MGLPSGPWGPDGAAIAPVLFAGVDRMLEIANLVMSRLHGFIGPCDDCCRCGRGVTIFDGVFEFRLDVVFAGLDIVDHCLVAARNGVAKVAEHAVRRCEQRALVLRRATKDADLGLQFAGQFTPLGAATLEDFRKPRCI